MGTLPPPPRERAPEGRELNDSAGLMAMIRESENLWHKRYFVDIHFEEVNLLF